MAEATNVAITNQQPANSRLLRAFRRSDSGFRALTLSAAVLVLILLGAIMLELAKGALPAFHTFGWKFFFSDAWNPVKDNFGALPAMFGTLITSAIAMLIAVPLGLGIAIFLTETCPLALRRPIGIAVELLAGVPSIIYGIWGLYVFAPFLQKHVQPGLISGSEKLPLLSKLFGGPPYGIGMLTAGLVLSIMVVPFITAVCRDVFETVPVVMKEAAYGLGCTTWEVVRQVVLPYTRVGIIGGVMLGLGRALGETMAVTFVIGNAHKIQTSLLAPGTTISATIANEFTEAEGDVYTSSLIALGLILFLITFVVLAVAQFMLARLERRHGGSHA